MKLSNAGCCNASSFDEANWEYLGLALILTLVVFFAALTHIWAGASGRVRAIRSRMSMMQFCRKLARLDLPRHAHEGPMDYVTRVVVAGPICPHNSRKSGRCMSTCDMALVRSHRN